MDPPAATVMTHSVETKPRNAASVTRESKEGQREHYQICATIQAVLPAMMAQHTQKIASVNSGFEDNTLRIIDISREQYTRKPLKYVVDLCTCCAKAQKGLKFLLGFFSRPCFGDLQTVCPAARAKGVLWIFGESSEVCFQYVVWIWEFVWNLLESLFMSRMIRFALRGARVAANPPCEVDQQTARYQYRGYKR